MPLTDTAIRTAKPRNKPYKMADEKGMFLYITPAGGKLWRLKYRVDGKEKLLSLGAYPDVGQRTLAPVVMKHASYMHKELILL